MRRDQGSAVGAGIHAVMDSPLPPQSLSSLPRSDGGDLASCVWVHVSTVCVGHPHVVRLVRLLKSILLHRETPLHLHVITSAETQVRRQREAGINRTRPSEGGWTSSGTASFLAPFSSRCVFHLQPLQCVSVSEHTRLHLAILTSLKTSFPLHSLCSRRLMLCFARGGLRSFVFGLL